jgi:tRNA(Ile)-lysidine synthase
MTAHLEQQVFATARKYRMLASGARVGVAVSGGGDSVALLRLLRDLRDRLGIVLFVVHFNHRLRGADSEADERFVADLAAEQGLDFRVARADVAAEARAHKWNVEDAGRRLRYRYFRELVTSGEATRIAVAHTLDDQAETVLARLLRGTGLTGLAGIYPVAGAVVRPLLEVRREHLREYLRQCGQTWREDASNSDAGRLRARLRHTLLPKLEHDFAAGVAQRLAQFAELAHDDEVFWNALVETRLREIARRSSGTLAVNIRDLLLPMPAAASARGVDQAGQPCDGALALEIAPSWQRALSQRLLRRIFRELAGESGQIGLRHVQQVMRLALEGCSGRQIELPGGVTAEKAFDDIIFSMRIGEKRREGRCDTTGREGRTRAATAWEYAVFLPRRGSATVLVPEAGHSYCLKVVDWPQPASDTRSAGDTLDIERLRSPLVLRSWRPGDAYRPVGRRQPHKVKRMFLARRIPFPKRANWPVLTSGGEVVWVKGMPLAHGFSAGKHTRKGVVIIEDGV